MYIKGKGGRPEAEPKCLHDKGKKGHSNTKKRGSIRWGQNGGGKRNKARGRVERRKNHGLGEKRLLSRH